MIPPMMFPRPKNLYMVHGWLVDDAVRNSMMMDKGADAKDLGITLSMTPGGKTAFVGRHLGTLDVRDGQEYVGVVPVSMEEQKSLEENMKKLGLPVVGHALLYVVAG